MPTLDEKKPWFNFRGCPEIPKMFLLTDIPNLTELLNNPGLTLIVRIGRVDPTFLLTTSLFRTPNSTRASRRGVLVYSEGEGIGDMRSFKFSRWKGLHEAASWF